MTTLTISRLAKHFGSPEASYALKAVDIEVQSGELLVLLGPSGCGKTTLLRSIAGLVKPSSGSISIGANVVSNVEAGVNVPPNKRNLGMVFQSFALWPHMTIEQNIAYPLIARRWRHARIAERVAEMLQLVQCEALAQRLPSTLSGGQQQRVALARALASQPAVILFDEPLSNLDALLRIELRSQLRMIHRATEFTGVFVTHDQIEAMSIGSRIAVMNQGRIEQLGTPEEVYLKPRTDFVAQFMGMSNILPFEKGELKSDRRSQDTKQCAFARFRPEDVQLNKPGTSVTTSPEGSQFNISSLRVVDRAFHGERVEYGLHLDGSTLKASLLHDGDVYSVGDIVSATVPGTKLSVFPPAQSSH